MPGSGGGAGGSIEILTRNIRGDSKIEARGGDGSINGGGGGSGGRMVINYLRGFSASQQPAQSHFWKGTYALTGGQYGYMSLEDENATFVNGASGQDGQILADKCFGGYSGPFCQACPEGTYKYDYSYAVCKPCDNKPKNSFYTGLASTDSSCPYECSQGLDPVDVNPLCRNALEIQVNRAGGMFSTLAFFAGFLTLVLLMWVALIIQSKLKSFGLNSFNSKVYDGVLFKDENIELNPAEKQVTMHDLAMRDEDIWSHTHRMYLLGDNSILNPWYLPSDFPNQALNPDDQTKLLNLIKDK